MNNSQTDQSDVPSASDPLAVFLSDPGSHLADILYLNFRVYKKHLLWQFFETALAALKPGTEQALHVVDVGA
ncbi:MAG: hypothetical protein WCO56_08110 [Verrucomicrobiota bacterium]